MKMRVQERCAWMLGGVLLTLSGAMASGQALSPEERAKVEAAVEQVRNATGVPSVSVGIARRNEVVYAEAAGSAILPRTVGVNTGGVAMQVAAVGEKAVKATAGMAYPVGSISKQFTAACILLLQERGRLKLDDPVSRWFPELTRANEVTVRNLLTHTSGYSDYAPQDYTIPAWTRPTNANAVVHAWATKPLDFDPGTKWQYSNTNFELAALIVEKASGESFHDFLWKNLITPLKLEGVLDLDVDRERLQVRGYEQHALGPMRPAMLEAPGWYFGDGALAMPVATLLRWDMSIAHRTLLKPESYAAMETPFQLKDGTDSHYGLGVFVQTRNGHRVISHSGEVGGYVANNIVLPDDDLAYAALTNQEASSAAGQVTKALTLQLAPFLVTAAAKQTVAAAGAAAKPAVTAQKPAAEMANVPERVAGAGDADAAKEKARAVLAQLTQGKIDRSLFTEDANFYFTPEVLDDFRSSLSPLGAPDSVTESSESLRGGMIFRSYSLTYGAKRLQLTTFTTTDGKLEQFLVGPSD